MPLENAKPGTLGFERNVKREIEAGKPPKQAVAIAYSKSGEKRSDAAPRAAKAILQELHALSKDIEEARRAGRKCGALLARERRLESEYKAAKEAESRRGSATTLDSVLSDAEKLFTRADAAQARADKVFTPKDGEAPWGKLEKHLYDNLRQNKKN